MTDLERRALLGDKQAQEECTEKGIVLTCPFCGVEAEVFKENDLFGIRCKNAICIGYDTKARFNYRKFSIESWNTRSAHPIGRCGECKRNHLRNGKHFCEIHGVVNNKKGLE